MINQLSQLQSLYPNLKDLNYNALTQNPNPNLFQFGQQNSPQPASKTQSTQPTTQSSQSNKSVNESTRQPPKQTKPQVKRE